MKGITFLKRFQKDHKNLNTLTFYFREQLAYLLKETAIFFDKRGLNNENNLIRQQKLTKHITIKSYEGVGASIDDNSRIAHFAHLFGNVEVGTGSRIEPFSVLEALDNRIEIGNNSYVGRYSVLRIRDNFNEQQPKSVVVGNGSVIGDKCYLSTCTIGDNVWIGDKVNIQEGTVIQDDVIILPNSNIGPYQVLEGGKVYAGLNEYDVVREVNSEDIQNFKELKETLANELSVMSQLELEKYYYINS